MRRLLARDTESALESPAKTERTHVKHSSIDDYNNTLHGYMTDKLSLYNGE